MELLFKAFLITHIIGGIMGLVTGTVNIIRKKGDKTHRIVGKLFTYSMLTVGFSALILSVLHPNTFLFIVGVFTTYLVGTGNRYIFLKLLAKNQKPTFIDWSLTIAMLAFGFAFIGLGTYRIVLGNTFGIVLIVFGILGLLPVRSDFINYKGQSKTKNYWLLAHIYRMIGGYIAAITAFLVVNSEALPFNMPPVVLWLLPTAVLLPLIIFWMRKFKIVK